jgi:ABC-type antimicrobial peptide transport system permease subunit
VIRTAGEPSGLIGSVQREIGRLDPELPPANVATIGEYLDRSLLAAKSPTVLISAFGFLAMALAMVGVYGVMSYLVSQRTREYGIRVALGAKQKEILSLVMRRGLLMTSIGVATGLALALAATRVLAGFLYEVSPLDPGVFAIVSLVLVTTALVAGFLPARAAARVSPIEVLRAE